MTDHRGYIARETAISAGINIVFGALFFLALFHGQTRVTLWGTGGIVVDCIPQGFMVGLMSVVPPSFFTRARIRSGAIVSGSGAPSRLQRALLVRVIMMAFLSLAGLTTTAALLALVSGIDTVPFAVGLALKAFAGGVVALLVTPPALRAMLVG